MALLVVADYIHLWSIYVHLRLLRAAAEFVFSGWCGLQSHFCVKPNIVVVVVVVVFVVDLLVSLLWLYLLLLIIFICGQYMFI